MAAGIVKSAQAHRQRRAPFRVGCISPCYCWEFQRQLQADAMNWSTIRAFSQLTDECDIEPDIGGQENIIAARRKRHQSRTRIATRPL